MIVLRVGKASAQVVLDAARLQQLRLQRRAIAGSGQCLAEQLRRLAMGAEGCRASGGQWREFLDRLIVSSGFSMSRQNSVVIRTADAASELGEDHLVKLLAHLRWSRLGNCRLDELVPKHNGRTVLL